MKVLMVTPTYYPTIGGIETFIETIAKSLNERNVSTDIMVLSRTADGNASWGGGVSSSEAGKVIRVPTSKIPEFQFLKRTITPFRVYLQTEFVPESSCLRLMKDYDILHFHDENDLSLFTFSFLIKKPKIFQYHTLPISLPYLKKKEKILCRYMLKKAVAYHFVNSEYSKNLLETMKISSERICVVPNAIDLNTYAPKPKPTGKSAAEDETKILCISRLSFEKLDAVTSVVNSASRLYEHVSKLSIVIVGTGPYYNYIKELAEKINKRLNKKIVTVLGGMKVESELINSSDIVVGVSRVALEAMACSKPVIIAGDRFIDGKSEAFFGGVVTKENAEELKYYNFCYKRDSERITPDKIVDAALNLLTNEKHKTEVGAFGRDSVEKEYDSNKIAQQLEDIYRFLEAQFAAPARYRIVA
jgi:glycosyltransferase involved in cell wall biosynthesis